MDKNHSFIRSFIHVNKWILLKLNFAYKLAKKIELFQLNVLQQSLVYLTSSLMNKEDCNFGTATI